MGGGIPVEANAVEEGGGGDGGGGFGGGGGGGRVITGAVEGSEGTGKVGTRELGECVRDIGLLY